MGAKRLAYFLPNSFTALNMACGFFSIVFSWEGKLMQAAVVLILGAIFDSVDGRVARMTGTESAFGEQFDSLSDLISFGMAPSFMLFFGFLHEYGRLGIAVAFTYLLCGALRLARFNISTNSIHPNYFQGLPIPGAALGIVGFIFLTTKFSFMDSIRWIVVPYTLLYALLMISNIPFCSFKDSNWIKKYRQWTLAGVLISVGMLYSYYKIAVIVLMSIYIIGNILYYITHRNSLSKVFNWEESGE